MNAKQAKKILEALDVFFREGNEVSGSSLLFDDSRTLREHIDEALAEKISVEIAGEARYEMDKGHRPRGRGGWLFCSVNPYRTDDYLQYLSPSFSGTYAEAKKQAKAWAREKGFRQIWVCP